MLNQEDSRTKYLLEKVWVNVLRIVDSLILFVTALSTVRGPFLYLNIVHIALLPQ